MAHFNNFLCLKVMSSAEGVGLEKPDAKESAVHRKMLHIKVDNINSNEPHSVRNIMIHCILDLPS